MKYALLVLVALAIGMLEAAPALRSKARDAKRGGVSPALRGNFHQSMHQPLFQRNVDRRNWQSDDKSVDKKSYPPQSYYTGYNNYGYYGYYTGYQNPYYYYEYPQYETIPTYISYPYYTTYPWQRRSMNHKNEKKSEHSVVDRKNVHHDVHKKAEDFKHKQHKARFLSRPNVDPTDSHRARFLSNPNVGPSEQQTKKFLSNPNVGPSEQKQTKKFLSNPNVGPSEQQTKKFLSKPNVDDTDGKLMQALKRYMETDDIKK